MDQNLGSGEHRYRHNSRSCGHRLTGGSRGGLAEPSLCATRDTCGDDIGRSRVGPKFQSRSARRRVANSCDVYGFFSQLPSASSRPARLGSA